MERHLNHTVVSDLQNELRDSFSGLNVADLNLQDISVDEFIDQLSDRSNLSKEEVSKIVEEKINYIYSKRIG